MHLAFCPAQPSLQVGKISFRNLKRIVTELGEDIPDDELRVCSSGAVRGVCPPPCPHPLPHPLPHPPCPTTPLCPTRPWSTPCPTLCAPAAHAPRFVPPPACTGSLCGMLPVCWLVRAVRGVRKAWVCRRGCCGGALQEMIAEADRDGDNLIDADEFFRVMKKRTGNALDDIDSDDD